MIEKIKKEDREDIEYREERNKERGSSLIIRKVKGSFRNLDLDLCGRCND